jgi:3'-5' exoribonuclease 1
MRYLIVDLEATCRQKGPEAVSRMEIIEIGAVMLASATGPIVSEFDSFVRPSCDPTLSDFCMELTSITQEQVDSADPFPVVFERFMEWAGAEPFVLCSWGLYDLQQFEVEFRQHGMRKPLSFNRHINLKRAFAEMRGIKPCGMKRALEIAGIPLEGTHHRGIDDARNIARLATAILSGIEDKA